MAFALSIVRLERSPQGSPAARCCRLGHEAAIQSLDSFLWENINDPYGAQTHQRCLRILPAAYRLLVAREMMTSGPLLGSISSMRCWRRTFRKICRKTGTKGLVLLVVRTQLRKRGIFLAGRHHKLLVPAGRCPVCVLTEESGNNVLATLFEVLDAKENQFIEAYQHSGGLCLQHLRNGLEQQRKHYAFATKLLIDDTVKRLDAQRAQMQEYLRKHNWSIATKK